MEKNEGLMRETSVTSFRKQFEGMSDKLHTMQAKVDIAGHITTHEARQMSEDLARMIGDATLLRNTIIGLAVRPESLMT
jgi:hypothetical protein